MTNTVGNVAVKTPHWSVPVVFDHFMPIVCLQMQQMALNRAVCYVRCVSNWSETNVLTGMLTRDWIKLESRKVLVPSQPIVLIQNWIQLQCFLIKNCIIYQLVYKFPLFFVIHRKSDLEMLPILIEKVLKEKSVSKNILSIDFSTIYF